MDPRAVGAIGDLLQARDSAREAVVAVLAGERAEAAVIGRGGAAPALRADDRFLLYSFTKTIVAAALLRFVAAGRIGLDDTLEAWWPELTSAGRVTLRLVLMHASGLADYGGLAAYHDAVRSGLPPWSEAEFLARSDAARLCFAPGDGWAYSNIGYMLLRRVLMRLGGGDMGAVLGREIFAPLGIASASVPCRADDLAGFAFGPSRTLGGAVPGRYHPGWIATGVVGATMPDAARMLRGILGGLLPTDLRDAMMRPEKRFPRFPARPFRAPAYGLGLMMDRDGAHGAMFGHTGGGPGCTPAVYHCPARDLTVAVAIDGEDQELAETILLRAVA